MANTLTLEKNRTKNIIKNIFKFVALYLGAMVFLLYFFFPTGILNNYIKSEFRLFALQNNLPLSIDIESVKPYWITGLELKGLKIHNIYQTEQSYLNISDTTVRLAVLPLLIGRANINTTIELEDGKSDISFSIPLWSVFSNNTQNFKLSVNFKKFQIKGLANQYFKALESSNNSGLMLLRPILQQTSIGGFLNGTLSFKQSNEKGNGALNLYFDELYLSIDDPALNIPTQHFKNAKINGSWNGQTYTINDQTKFESENLYLQPKGTVQTIGAGQAASSVLNLDLLLILSGEIEKNFGFLIPQLLKCPSTSMIGGVMNVKLVGPISQYACQ